MTAEWQRCFLSDQLLLLQLHKLLLFPGATHGFFGLYHSESAVRDTRASRVVSFNSELRHRDWRVLHGDDFFRPSLAHEIFVKVDEKAGRN